MSKKDKIEDKIKDLNEMRAVYHRDLEEFERRYKEKEISKEELEKHKINYEEKREKIRNKIHSLEEKLGKIRKNP
jgi:chromosome segregation ATPase